MSRPKYWWYGNVCRIIGEYPRLDEQARSMSRRMSRREKTDHAAIRKTVLLAQTWPDGDDVLKIVKAYAWDRPHEDMETAAKRIFVSVSTAKRMYGRFVHAAAKELGYKS